MLVGNKRSIPFRQLGQYEDSETELYYNRFRYYSANTGGYISKDPIGLDGNNPNLYAYVWDSNAETDVLGLISTAPGVYDVFFEAYIPQDMFTLSDRAQFQEANRQLFNAMNNDPKLKAALEAKFPGIYAHVSPGARGAFRGTAFGPSTTWHHHPQVGGLLQLVDRSDHKLRFPDYHPKGYGGREKWGGGSKYR